MDILHQLQSNNLIKIKESDTLIPYVQNFCIKNKPSILFSHILTKFSIVCQFKLSNEIQFKLELKQHSNQKGKDACTMTRHNSTHVQSKQALTSSRSYNPRALPTLPTTQVKYIFQLNLLTRPLPRPINQSIQIELNTDVEATSPSGIFNHLSALIKSRYHTSIIQLLFLANSYHSWVFLDKLIVTP